MSIAVFVGCLRGSQTRRKSVTVVEKSLQKEISVNEGIDNNQPAERPSFATCPQPPLPPCRVGARVGSFF